MGPRAAAKKRRDFAPHAFLATIGEGGKFLLFPKKQGIFAQGDTADAVLYPRAFGDMQSESAKADRAVDGFCRAKPPQPLHIAIYQVRYESATYISSLWPNRGSAAATGHCEPDHILAEINESGVFEFSVTITAPEQRQFIKATTSGSGLSITALRRYTSGR